MSLDDFWGGPVYSQGTTKLTNRWPFRKNSACLLQNETLQSISTVTIHTALIRILHEEHTFNCCCNKYKIYLQNTVYIKHVWTLWDRVTFSNPCSCVLFVFFSFSLFLLFERLAVFLSQNRSQYHGIYNMRTVAILYSKVHQYSTVTISCKYHISAIIVSDKNTFSIQLS